MLFVQPMLAQYFCCGNVIFVGQSRERDALGAAQAPDCLGAQNMHQRPAHAAMTQPGGRNELIEREFGRRVQHARIRPVVVVVQRENIILVHPGPFYTT